MGEFTNLAAINTYLQDGNLRDNSAPDTIKTLIIGTSAKGVSGRVVTVRDPGQVQKQFGMEGTLMRGMFEAFGKARFGARSVAVLRIGGTALHLYGIGNSTNVYDIADATTLRGVELVPWEYSEDVADRYEVQYTNPLLQVWNNVTGIMVLEVDFTDPASPVTTVDFGEVTPYFHRDPDTGNVVEAGTGNDFTTPDADSYGYTLRELSDTGSGEPLITGIAFVDATTGLSPTPEELYEALHNAYETLEDEGIDYIHPMGAFLDELNQADVDQGILSASVLVGQDHLRYLLVEEDDDTFENVFTWSTTKETDYHEVNFAYQLANFCYNMTINERMVYGVVGVRPPDGLDPISLKRWLGRAPTYDLNDSTLITAPGSGLLGNKFMAGRPAFAPGFYATQSGWLDDADTVLDLNEVEIDIGKHLAVVANYVSITNKYSSLTTPREPTYLASFAATYCGVLSSTNPAESPTNRLIPSNIGLPYKIGKNKLDLLSKYHYVYVRPSSEGLKIGDGWSAARDASDYKRASTFIIIKECDRRVRKVADKYLGKGMSMLREQAFRTDLDKAFEGAVGADEGTFLQTVPTFNVTATPLERANGFLTVFGNYVPMFEVRKIKHVSGMRLQ